MLNNNKLIEEIEDSFLKRVISKYNSDIRTHHFDTQLYAWWYLTFKSYSEIMWFDENNKPVTFIANMLIYLFYKRENCKIKYNMLIITRIIRTNLLEIYYNGIISLSG